VENKKNSACNEICNVLLEKNVTYTEALEILETCKVKLKDLAVISRQQIIK